MFSPGTGRQNKKIVPETRVGCCLLVAPVVSRRPWEAGWGTQRRENRWKEGVGLSCGWGRMWVVGCSHAVTEGGLWRLAVVGCCCVAVAVGLLRRHGHVGPCCEHKLGCACKTTPRWELKNTTAAIKLLNLFSKGTTVIQFWTWGLFYRKQWVETL